MQTIGLSSKCSRGTLISGEVLHGQVKIGEALVVAWSKAGKSMGTVLAITIRDGPGEEWTDAAYAHAGCEVQIIIEDASGSGGFGYKQSKMLPPARFLYKDGAEGEPVLPGQSFVAKLYVYSGEEVKIGTKALCTFSSSVQVEVKLKEIVWMETEAAGGVVGMAETIAKSGGRDGGTVGGTNDGGDMHNVGTDNDGGDTVGTDGDSGPATDDDRSVTTTSTNRRTLNPKRLQPPCYALCVFRVHNAARQRKHDDISWMALTPRTECPPCGQFSIVDLNSDLRATHHNRNTLVAIGEVCDVTAR
jgi:hypothetical protein